jgi:xylulokinase
LRYAIEAVEDAGTKLKELRLAGGGTKSQLWRRIVCDITGKRVVFVKNQIPETFGAALLAAIGLKIHSVDRMNDVVKTSGMREPDKNARLLYEKGFRAFKATYDYLSPTYEDLTDLRNLTSGNPHKRSF